jgi:hypothetical protein
MARRRRRNPDPVAAIAAAIPSSVPAPIASAAVAGAASAAAKTNPGRRGRGRRRNCGYRMNPGKRRRKGRGRMSPGRRATSRLRSTWKRRTRRGGRYAAYGAVVRTTKSGSPRRGRRKHVKGKGHAWTGRKGTVALYSRKTGKLWGTNPKRHGRRDLDRRRRFNRKNRHGRSPAWSIESARARRWARTNPKRHRGGRNKRRGRAMNREERYETGWRGQSWRARMKTKNRHRRGRR